MKEERIESRLLGIFLLLGLFLPHTSTVFLAINPIMCLVLYLVFRYKNKSEYRAFGLIKFLLCAVIIISLFASLAFIRHSSIKYLLSSIYLLLLVFTFPFVGRSKIPNAFFYVAISYILLSQLIYLFEFHAIERVLELLYPISENDMNSFEYMTRNISTSNIFRFRLGGLFHNPNQCSRYVCLITAAFLVDRPYEKLKNVLPFVFLVVFSVVLTGSRSGLVVISLIIGMFVYGNSSIKKNFKYAMFLGALMIIIPLFITGSDTFRGFNISQGFNNSTNVKWTVFMDYLSQDNSPFHLLFGYADISTFSPTYTWVFGIFDSEYGNLVYCYGFLGFFLVAAFYFKAIVASPKQCRFFYLMLLWMITSTILMSYRMSFLFMLFLSHIVSLKQDSMN